MALPPLVLGRHWVDLLVKDPLTYVRHMLRGNRSVDEDFARASPTRPPVLLIHGYLGTRGALYLLEQRLRGDGFAVFSINLGTLNIQDIRKSAFQIHLAIEKIRAATGGRVPKIDVVGHSMGGLIALYYIKFMGGDAHVRKLVSLGTPYKGTWASLMGIATLGTFSPSTWQMLPGSYFLRMLAAMALPPTVEWVSVIARYDALCPPHASRVSPGTNYDLPIGHAGLVLSADVFRLLKRVLRRDHEPSARTTSFVMVDGKWVRQLADGSLPGAKDRRRQSGERRRTDRRAKPRMHVVPGGRVAAFRARKKK